MNPIPPRRKWIKIMSRAIELALVGKSRERKMPPGRGVDVDKTHAMRAENGNAQVARSICPYCGSAAEAADVSQGGK